MAVITARVDTGARFTQELQRVMYRELRKTAEAIGTDMAAMANDYVSSRYNQRPYDRRRHPGSRRLAGAIDFRVTGDALPFELTFRVNGGDDVVRRCIVLNFGHSGATIVPSGTWPLRGRYGSSPFQRRGSSGIAASKLAWPSSGSGPPDIFVNEVRIPGRGGDGFLEDARDRAIARHTS